MGETEQAVCERETQSRGSLYSQLAGFVYSKEYSGVCVCGASLKKSNDDSCDLLSLSVSMSTAVVQVDGNPVRLQLCDTAGQVSFVQTHTLHMWHPTYHNVAYASQSVRF